MPMNTRFGSVCVISLGCAKNLVDSEHMLGILQAKGFTLTSDMDKADFAVINTCGFLESAVEEAIDVVLETARLKKQGPLRRLVVAGCMVQRYGYKLARELPEVDAWLGTGEISRVAEVLRADSTGPVPFYISRPTFLAGHAVPRVQSTPFYTAYLKIAEGCSHRCAYCIIPKLRGPFRSRPIPSLIREVKKMAQRGVKEINLIAQDTSLYGKDLYGEPRLTELIEKMIPIEGVQWIRILYLHPHRVSESLLDLMEAEETVCPYLDIPFQHVNPDLLRAMGREPRGETPEELIQRIRGRKRDIVIRTTLMVGFPGETEEMFGQLCSFVGRADLDHVGVFAFSPEKGAPAARFPSKVDPAMAQKRLTRLMGIQARVSKRLNAGKVGQVLPALIEGPSPETDLLLIGRTAGMAPDVDSRVLINDGEGIAGRIMPVHITEAHTYDLVGRIPVH
ncbi:MAG: 30S ribosomal protein S12 methylthiotransferase RimO [Deltaproteobacteria bacterium]|nr:30S ribosomal protein S12 methylthiotransferase RimO [Deltaproteobacteria bacterium]